MDLYFSDIEERNRQYNARNSVADFENCMQIYRQLAEQAKQRVVGLYDIAYGVSKQEKLDIFPSVSQPLQYLFIFMVDTGGLSLKMMLVPWQKIWSNMVFLW